VRKGIVLLLCLSLLLSALASVALSAPQRENEDEAVGPKAYVAVAPPRPQHVSVEKITRVIAFRPPLPKLVLPDVSARVRSLARVDRSLLPAQLRKSEQVIAFFAKRRWVTAPAKQKCWDVPWQRTCTVARAQLRLHHELAETAAYRLDHELPLINDWKTAVRWVQRIYPGTESWMLYISDREGGWGPWVWYGGSHWYGHHIGNDFLGADTVGGWMQFRYSTFAPYWRHAQFDLARRGYVVPFIPMPAAGGPSKYAAWLSPLGQALTAGYMRYTGRDGCHWCL
jgi:hypothetical protein